MTLIKKVTIWLNIFVNSLSLLLSVKYQRNLNKIRQSPFVISISIYDPFTSNY